MHPRLLISRRAVEGPNDSAGALEALRGKITAGHARTLWETILRRAWSDARREGLVAGDLDVGAATEDTLSERLLSASLACLLGGEQHFADGCYRQIRRLADSAAWPRWTRSDCRRPADGRTASLVAATALALDWCGPMWSRERASLVETVLIHRGLEPLAAALGEDIDPAERPILAAALTVGALAAEEICPEAARWLDRAEALLAADLPERMRAGLGSPRAEGELAAWAVLAGWALRSSGRREAEEPIACAEVLESVRSQLLLTLPPGRLPAWGEAPEGCGPVLRHVPVLAAETADPYLQWQYLTFYRPGEPGGSAVLELLGLDAELESEWPEGRLPRGERLGGDGGRFVSREDWQSRSSPCVVFGKCDLSAGPCGHGDAGGVCVDGFGEPLVIDPGSVPAEFRGAAGHNVPVLDGGGQDASSTVPAAVLGCAFDERRGGWWRLDLTGRYPAAVRAVRTVVHLLGGVVAVLDELAFPCGDDDAPQVRVRWHLAGAAECDAEGRFALRCGDVSLSGRLGRVDGPARVADGCHELPGGRRIPYAELICRGREVRVLSLLAVFDPGSPSEPWRLPPDALRTLDAPCGLVQVAVEERRLAVENVHLKRKWSIDLS